MTNDRWRSQSRSSGSTSPSYSSERRKTKGTVDEPNGFRSPRPYMKQVKLHPSGCQQWSSQIVAGGGFYMAYASTLTTYVYDVRDYSLVTILGGNECNVHSLLWHPHNPYRLLVFSVNGNGSEWDIRTEEQVQGYHVGAPPECSAWDPSDQSNLVVISKEANAIHLLRKDDGGKRGRFSKGYTRRPGDNSLASTCAKWSLNRPGVLVVGWTDGRVSFTGVSANVGQEKTKLVSPCPTAGSVVDLRHDPNGGAYLLVAYSSGSVILWDASGHSSVAEFDRCAVGLIGVRWMAWAPGNFMVLSSKTAIARVFTVSQKHCIRTIRLGETGSGIRDVAWLPAQGPGSSQNGGSPGPRAICGFRDGSLSIADAAFGERGADSLKGVVGEGGSGAIPWSSKAGHVETVFGCAHNPRDADTLATCSYGSNVKVWHVPTMDLKVTLTGQTGAVYNVAWSPDGDRIASSSGDGTVWIWDAECGKTERRLRLHSRAVHRVEWDPHKRGRLASASTDRSLVIFSDQGKVERIYFHPGPLFGCHWCPGLADVIATGCQDGNVRIFDVSWANGLEPQYILSGHSKRVFRVCWSPLLSDTLASGSDDCTVMVWSLGVGVLPRSTPVGSRQQIRPTSVLRGHTSYVRPLFWNSEVPWLLLSGSWDGTVRAWDIRRARLRRSNDVALDGATPRHPEERDACIAMMSDHVADVYGLSAGLDRPFLYVSVSRDTTIRQFTIEGVVSSIKVRAVMGNTLEGGLGNIRDAMLRAAPTTLCGDASNSLETQLLDLKRSEGVASINAYRRIFDFFWGSDGMDTFWETLRSVAAASEGASKAIHAPVVESSTSSRCSEARSNPTEGGGITVGATFNLRELPRGLMMVDELVIHRDARRAFHRALAGRLVSSPTFIVQDRRISKSDRLERAARLYLATGDARSACEALVALGKWERALALAPGVGSEYWRELADRFVEAMLAGGGQSDRCAVGEGSSEPSGTDATALATGLMISAGRPMEAAGLLAGSDEALTLAISVADGAYPPPAQASALSTQRSDTDGRAINEVHSAIAKDPEAKLLALLEQGVTGTACACREGTAGSRGGQDTPSNENEEARASPKYGRTDEHQMDSGGNEAATHAIRSDPLYSNREYKDEMLSPVEHESEHEHPNLPAPRALHAEAQRGYAEAAIREITQSRAKVYFRASQPVLAAATVLSVCDGLRVLAAPAVSYLLQGNEPELAFAAARVLHFPARELRPLVCEMARRAEAWGDANLAAELLLEAGGDGDSSAREQTAYDDPDKYNTGEAGYWPMDLYGTSGENAGPRGAAQVASRYGDAARTNPSTGLSRRSASSYLEDAGCSARHGVYAEAVRLLVLGGDLVQAAVRGISFLRHTLSVSSFPPGSLKSALAVSRALGSGPSLGSELSQPLRAEVLAYSSYVGALEAAARGYRQVVVPLLRNTFVCVKLVEKLRGATCAEDSTASDGKQTSDADGNQSPRQHDDDAWQLPPIAEVFPLFMSPEALEAAASHWLEAESLSGADIDRVPDLSTSSRKEVNREDISVCEAKAVDHLLTCAKLAARRRGIVARRALSLTGPETKQGEIDRDEWGKKPSRAGSNPGGNRYDEDRGDWVGAWGEIIVGGSRLPSCRHHEQNSWSKAALHGRQAWPMEGGATFTLEDGITTIGLNKAVMWAKVNPFSPLNSGQRIMPF